MPENKEPFSVSRAGDSTGFLLLQVTMLWQRRVARALRPYGLTQVQYALLASLLWLARSDDSISQVTLARHTKMDITMCSQVLRTLEKVGLLRRQAHARDARVKVLALTPSGARLVRETVPVVEAVDARFFHELGSGLKGFNQLLDRLVSAANRRTPDR
jgi:DNA-binding MarR family transcriptional regulator